MNHPSPRIYRLQRLAGILAFGFATASASGAVEYTVVNLGTLGGAVEATGLNDHGQAVGWSVDNDGHTNAFLWQNGAMTSLGFLPGATGSFATAINNLGEVTGRAFVSRTNYHAFLHSGGVMADLGALGAYSAGLAINEHSDVSGWTWPAPAPRALAWWTGGTLVSIPPWHDKGSAPGYGINEDGRIAGTTVLDIPDTNREWGYVWHDDDGDLAHDYGEMKLLGTLGGDFSGAWAINDSGQVVGEASIGTPHPFFPKHAFLVTPSNGVWKLPNATNVDRTNLLMQGLGVLGGPTNNSYAKAINNQAWIVGTADMPTGTNQAFLWREGVLTNLNLLIPPNSGWVLTHATGINEYNEIVGNGLYQGQPRAFMLRQEGRISEIAPVDRIEFLVTTNEFEEIVTQEIVHVETQVLHWSGIWGTNAEAPREFTVEYCDALKTSNWTPVAPTAQWPIAETFWTNPAFGSVSARYFRVRAQPAE
jgi:probable HAF family extracellular repeat protein